MASQVDQQLAFILHLRDFTDSKKLVTLFSREQGLFTAVARPAKRWPALQPFQPLLVSFFGKQNLKNLRSVEASDYHAALTGRSLFCAMYLNEVLCRALSEAQAVEHVFDVYRQTLVKLGAADSKDILQVLLRRFELSLLHELGFGIDLLQCGNGTKVHQSAESYYQFELGRGLMPSVMTAAEAVLNGRDLHAIANEDWQASSLAAAKRLCRQALVAVIGTQPLKSRELFS